MHRLRALIPALLLTSAAFAAAEDGPAAPPAKPAGGGPGAAPGAVPAEPTKADAPKAAAQPAQDVEPVTGTLYAVRLKSQRAIRGVVHAKSVYERKDAEQGWVAAKKDEAGAGVRLWYPSLLDGFMFVAAKDIVQFEDLGALSTADGMKIARERVDAGSRAESERRRLKAEAEARRAKEDAASAARAEVEAERKAAGEQAKGALESAGAMVPLDRAKRFAELIEKFPPTVWHPDTPKEIERRRVVLDLFPTDEEKEFLSVYAEWREAYEFWRRAGVEGATEAVASEAGTTADGVRANRAPR